MNVIVTRHAGLLAWLQRNGVKADRVVTGNVTADDVRGNHVFGILPLWLAAEAKSMTEVSIPGLPFEMRGKEYGPDQMDEWGATMVTYKVTKT